MVKKTVLPISIPDEFVEGKIYEIRGQKVMLDRDLASLYAVETRILKQAVKRNIHRFPEDFMFEMNEAEFRDWRSQFVISNQDRQGLRHAPYCFTEPGVTMLSCILNSQRAIAVNIQIIRIFTKMRQLLTDTTQLQLEIHKIKKKLDNHDKNIELVFNYLDELLEKQKNPPPRKKIGFRNQVNS